MSTTDRQYECIVFGASGYTGKYTTEHIASSLPTDFKWAVAGRNREKLEKQVEEIRALNPDRTAPGIEVAQLKKDELLALVKKTKVLITTVGPYHKYGTEVFAACAETGTHYLDVTGEVPWTLDMIKKYHDTAKRTGAIMIPQNGVESAPADLMSWGMVSYIRSTLNVGTAELVQATYEMSASPSGGTLDTVFSIFDTYSLSQFAAATDRWSLSPVPAPTQPATYRKSIMETVTGIRAVPDLGIMTDSLQGPTDTPIVHRSWGLYDGGKFYGPRFHLSAYMKARNELQAFFVHAFMVVGMMALVLPPVRWLMKKVVFQPGQGPDKEEANKGYMEWRAIANADVQDANDPKRAFGRMRWEGSMYYLTGACLAEAALILAREDDTLAHKIGGGVLTPATLGEKYLDRMQKVGLKFTVKMMP